LSKTFTDIAQRFVAGECLAHMGKMIGMSRNTLRQILTTRCGPDWVQNFKAKRFDIDVKIPTKVPPLIDDPKLIEAVKARVQANKTVYHGYIKTRKIKDKDGKVIRIERRRSIQKYLFSRMIMCKNCGLALFGEFMNGKTRHYRHRATMGRKGHRIPVECDNFRYVPCDLIEEEIMAHIFELFGDQVKVEQALKDAIPNLDELKELKLQIKQCKREKQVLEKKIERLLDSIERGEKGGILTNKRLKKYEDQYEAFEEEISSIESKISKIPTEKDIRKHSSFIRKMIKRYYLHDEDHYSRMTFDDRRKLLGHLFSGTDKDGRRCGIYIKRCKDGWEYEICGALISDIDKIPDKKNVQDVKTKIINKP
jgi:hypothetical protein